MKLFKTSKGFLVEENGILLNPMFDIDWDELINRDNLHSFLKDSLSDQKVRQVRISDFEILKPIGISGSLGSRRDLLLEPACKDGRIKRFRGGDFYSRVYVADRPEIFFKATSSRTVGPGEPFRIRNDSTWDVPEPELTLCVTSSGKIVGYTIGNDVSSRSIEGENPLYLPQAKTLDACACLGPCLYVTENPLSEETSIKMEIIRGSELVLDGQTSLKEMKRKPQELVNYLLRETSFPQGVFLMTGTGIVPGTDFSLKLGDLVQITIDPIGTLSNTVGA